jgi:hypothetical protein
MRPVPTGSETTQWDVAGGLVEEKVCGVGTDTNSCISINFGDIYNIYYHYSTLIHAIFK